MLTSKEIFATFQYIQKQMCIHLFENTNSIYFSHLCADQLASTRQILNGKVDNQSPSPIVQEATMCLGPTREYNCSTNLILDRLTNRLAVSRDAVFSDNLIMTHTIVWAALTAKLISRTCIESIIACHFGSLIAFILAQGLYLNNGQFHTERITFIYNR